ncbi:isochorismatase family protein [Mesorhizobium australicum]|uniref:Nicotinamidase-related amidase n=1 Tax=Mesorhizobium australicum TaxID=536018 RepID=A0A1X7MNU1_9HYPH|nr:isochorismatase family protein [Mesorhizobium australicum]SMH26500.1 Nicotinamidase-related amidase [Mesorhizobium australicum]
MTDIASAAERAFFEDRGFAAKMGFGQRPALLVVDFSLAFTDPAMPLGSVVDGPIAETNRLLAAAHAMKVPVFFTVISYDEDDIGDAGVWRLKITSLSTLKASTRGVELDPRLDRRPNDPLILKKYASCFFGTDLASRLQIRGIDTLLVAGCATSGCVKATVIDACQLGFRPMIAREAVADRSAPAHAQSLWDMDAIYGDVLPVDEIVAYMESLS